MIAMWLLKLAAAVYLTVTLWPLLRRLPWRRLTICTALAAAGAVLVWALLTDRIGLFFGGAFAMSLIGERHYHHWLTRRLSSATGCNPVLADSALARGIPETSRTATQSTASPRSVIGFRREPTA